METYINKPSSYSSTTLKGHENILKMRQGHREIEPSFCRLLPESRCQVERKSRRPENLRELRAASANSTISDGRGSRNRKSSSFAGMRKQSIGRRFEDSECLEVPSDDSQDEDEMAYDRLQISIENYKRICKMLGTIPVTLFSRECVNEIVNVSSIQLEPVDIKAISLSLMSNLTVKHLDVSNNNIGEKGAMYLAEGLKENIVITHLNLSNTSIGVDGLALLTPVIIRSGTLQSLNLSDNGLKSCHIQYLAEIITDADTLLELDLSYNSLDAECGLVIGESLSSYSTLKKLNLKWNHIRQRGAVAICAGLEINDVLEELNLAWNGFGGEGTVAMSKTLLSNSTLKHLDLTCNRIDQNSLQFLLEGLMRNESLEILKIGQNPITTLGALAIIKAVEKNDNSKLKDLFLTGIPVNEEFLEQLKETQDKHQDLRVYYPEDIGYLQLKKVKVDPAITQDAMVVLFQHMKQENLRIVDLFRSFDTDNSRTISKTEFRKGFANLNLPLTDRALDRLMEELDINANEEVEYTELKIGQRKASSKITSRSSSLKTDALFKLKNLVKQALGEKTKPDSTVQSKAYKIKRQRTLTSLVEDVLATQ